MSFSSIDAWWWPFLFIFLVGSIPTGMWRWIGVLLVGGIEQGSETLILIRCVATAFVAAVIAQIIFAPSGALGLIPVWVRLGSALIAFAAFLLAGRRMIVGIVAGEVLLLAGYWLTVN